MRADEPRTGPRRDVLLAVAIAYAGLQVALNGCKGYGYFNDEFYYLACARRLALGYVDHPPLAPFLLRLLTSLTGVSIAAIRLPAAIAGGATVYLAGRMAWRLGGDVRAQTLAALAMAAAPGPMILFGFFSTNPFEILVWTLIADLALAIAGGADPRMWVAMGVVAGLGLENKHTTVLFVGALAVGLVATSAREHLRGPWPWAGLAAALLVFAPNLAWEARHGWVSLEFYRVANAVKNVPTTSWRAGLDQVLFMNPVMAPLWIIGLVWLLAARRVRFLAVAFLVLFALLLAFPTSRPDRIAGAYPMLLSAGAVALAPLRARLARGALIAALAFSTAVMAPLALPILSPASLASYSERLGINPQIELQRRSRVPQWVADRLDWEELAEAVAGVARGLPPEERRAAAVFAWDYAYAASLELYGPARGVPRVISTHNNYFLWGPGTPAPSTVIAVGVPRPLLDRLFAEVTGAAVFHCDFCYQDGMAISVARNPRLSLAEAWPGLKHFE
jgi:hypothetical protein